MAKLFQQIRVGGLTDDAVKAQTGKTWGEWCKILDKAGARMMDHDQIGALLQEQTGLTDWWSQTVAVGYEIQRGIRQSGRNQAPGKHFQVTLAKIVVAPPAVVWAAWQDPATLASWLPDAEFEVLKTVPNKALDLDWPDRTRVVVRFYERRGKTKVVVSHRRLGGSDVARLRIYWSAALDRLEDAVAR
jgi:hypothetical protein